MIATANLSMAQWKQPKSYIIMKENEEEEMYSNVLLDRLARTLWAALDPYIMSSIRVHKVHQSN